MKRIIGVAAAVLLLAGCSDQAPTMAPGTPAPSTPAGETPSAAPKTLVGKVGDTYVGKHVDATVEEFNPRVTTSASGQTWKAALVKTCVKVDGITVSSWPWQAIGVDSGRYRNPSGTYGDAPKPGYPDVNEQVLKGECIRGWILFDSPVDVVEIRYAAEGEGPARWMLGG